MKKDANASKFCGRMVVGRAAALTQLVSVETRRASRPCANSARSLGFSFAPFRVTLDTCVSTRTPRETRHSGAPDTQRGMSLPDARTNSSLQSSSSFTMSFSCI